LGGHSTNHLDFWAEHQWILLSNLGGPTDFAG